MLDRGYVQVYTGDGKGKTTAALGLILRACGAGLHVFFAQFLKKREHSELVALRRFSDLVTVRQFGSGSFVKESPTREDHLKAQEGFEVARQAILSRQYDLVVLDEINLAVANKLVQLDDLLNLIDARPANVELVLTGRRADPRLLDVADLVTEMRDIRHYYRNGVKARQGIEK